MISQLPAAVTSLKLYCRKEKTENSDVEDSDDEIPGGGGTGGGVEGAEGEGEEEEVKITARFVLVDDIITHLDGKKVKSLRALPNHMYPPPHMTHMYPPPHMTQVKSL